jgi:hypothetical protein
MIRLVELKKILKEEISFRLKNGLISEGGLLTEQDGYTYYEIKPVVSGAKIKIAVKGGVIHSVIANEETGEFEIGVAIGGGNLEDLKQNISNKMSGQYLEGRKYADSFVGGNVQAIRNYFSNRPEITSDYGFIFDDKGLPSLVAFDASNNKPLFAVAIPMGKGELVKYKTVSGGGGGTSKAIAFIEITDGFVVNDDALNSNAQTKLDAFISQMQKYADKIEEKNFVIISSASADKRTSKADDTILSQDRALNALGYLRKKLGEYGFTFEYVSLGQTSAWDASTEYKVEEAIAKGASKSEIDALYKKSGVNRKLLVVPKSKYGNYIPTNYRGKVILQK